MADGEGGGGGELTPEQRDAADRKRQAEADALAKKLKDAEENSKKLEAKLDELKKELDRKPKGSGDREKLEDEVAALKRTVADQTKANEELAAKWEKAEKRAAQKTIDADVRALLDGEVPDVSAAMKYLGGDLRVDADGKPAIRLKDGSEEFGTLTKEALLDRLPDVLKSAKGAPGSGVSGNVVEHKTKDVVTKALATQADFEKAEKDGTLHSALKKRELSA